MNNSSQHVHIAPETGLGRTVHENSVLDRILN